MSLPPFLLFHSFSPFLSTISYGKYFSNWTRVESVIYAISSIDEGIEILTGVPAGKKNKDGKFPAGTIKYLAYEKLKRYAENAKENK